jgi:hypothetical protein
LLAPIPALWKKQKQKPSENRRISGRSSGTAFVMRRWRGETGNWPRGAWRPSFFADTDTRRKHRRRHCGAKSAEQTERSRSFVRLLMQGMQTAS